MDLTKINKTYIRRLNKCKMGLGLYEQKTKNMFNLSGY